jgi:hypothetical protein
MKGVKRRENLYNFQHSLILLKSESDNICQKSRVGLFDVQENFIDIKRQAELFSLFTHVIHFRIFDRIS